MKTLKYVYVHRNQFEKTTDLLSDAIVKTKGNYGRLQDKITMLTDVINQAGMTGVYTDKQIEEAAYDLGRYVSYNNGYIDVTAYVGGIGDTLVINLSVRP